LKPNRIVVGKFLRLHWELHLQVPDVQTLRTIKTQPQMQHYPGILPKFGDQNVQEFVAFTLGRTSKGRQGDDFLNSQLFVGTGECTKGVRTDDIVLLLYGRHYGYFWGMGSTADSQHMSASAPLRAIQDRHPTKARNHFFGNAWAAINGINPICNLVAR